MGWMSDNRDTRTVHLHMRGVCNGKVSSNVIYKVLTDLTLPLAFGSGQDITTGGVWASSVVFTLRDEVRLAPLAGIILTSCHKTIALEIVPVDRRLKNHKHIEPPQNAWEREGIVGMKIL